MDHDRANEEARLIERLDAGDAAAQDELVAAVLPDVLRWCVRLGGDLVDPEDAAHEVLIVALRRLPTFRRGSSLRGWLFGITRRVLANHRRKARTRKWWVRLTGTGEADRPDASPSPHTDAEHAQRRRLVQRCLQQVTRKQREVLVLCDLEGRTAREAAEILGVAENSVYSRLHHARKAFRRGAEELGLERALRDGLQPSGSGEEPGRRGGDR